MRAVVSAPICPLMSRPSLRCPRADEALLGWPVEVLDSPCPGWSRVRTHYGYEGFAPTGSLCMGEGAAARWATRPKAFLSHGAADVLSGPQVECWPVETLVRGSLTAPLGPPVEGGWQKIALPDGREGYIKCNFLSEYYPSPPELPPDALRHAIAATALAYQGTQYRWGGKTPMGIDCSGLASMAYLLNGILIYRDAKIMPGFPIHPINRAAMDVADLLYFPGHVALYLGEGAYVHATAREGGVVISSLEPEDPRYREDLAGQLLAVGSYFG